MLPVCIMGQTCPLTDFSIPSDLQELSIFTLGECSPQTMNRRHALIHSKFDVDHECINVLIGPFWVLQVF